VLTRPQSALATQRLIHAGVGSNFKKYTMIKKFTLITATLIICGSVFSQLSHRKLIHIDKYAYKMDGSQRLDSLELKFDSIEVYVIISENKLATVNKFINSNSVLSIDYYFKNSKLILVRVHEKSPKFPDQYNFSSFYFSNDSIVSEKSRFTIPQGLPIPMEFDIYELFGYNRTFSSNFIKEFIVTLLEKTKLPPTACISHCW
jgi:hypothetical protein